MLSEKHENTSTEPYRKTLHLLACVTYLMDFMNSFSSEPVNRECSGMPQSIREHHLHHFKKWLLHKQQCEQ